MEFKITDELSLSLIEEDGEKKLIVAIAKDGSVVEVEMFAEEVAPFKKVVSNLYGLMK